MIKSIGFKGPIRDCHDDNSQNQRVAKTMEIVHASTAFLRKGTCTSLTPEIKFCPIVN